MSWLSSEGGSGDLRGVGRVVCEIWNRNACCMIQEIFASITPHGSRAMLVDLR